MLQILRCMDESDGFIIIKPVALFGENIMLYGLGNMLGIYRPSGTYGEKRLCNLVVKGRV